MTTASGDAAAYLAANPDVIVEQYARQTGLTPREVVEALPQPMRAFADGRHFVEVMSDIAQWGDVTLIVHTEDGIL